jgi:hypothetical protein
VEPRGEVDPAQPSKRRPAQLQQQENLAEREAVHRAQRRSEARLDQRLDPQQAEDGGESSVGHSGAVTQDACTRKHPATI